MQKLRQELRPTVPAVGVMIPLRLLDPGKWTDCPWFIEAAGSHRGGLVVNMSGLLLPWNDRGGIFKRVKVIMLPDCPWTPEGYVTVSSGADSDFGCGVKIDDIACGKYDVSNDIITATLSQFEFDGMSRRIHLAINSGIGPGASLGTSASVQVGILRALSAPQMSAYRIAMLAVDAQLNKCRQATGNQDQLAAAFGSDKISSTALKIEINDFPEAKVTPLVVGPRIKSSIETSGVVTFIGSHFSGHEHERARQRICADKALACVAFTQMIAAAEVTACAIKNDAVGDFACALDMAVKAHGLVHPDLIGIIASGLMARARSYGAISAMLPGAGGNGGSVFSLFGSGDEAAAYVAATDKFRNYRIKLVA